VTEGDGVLWSKGEKFFARIKQNGRRRDLKVKYSNIERLYNSILA
jgi:hypothetical protein